VKHLTGQLSLSDDQQAKVKSALEQQQKQMQDLRSDSSLSRDDRAAKMHTIHDSTTTQIKSVLNEDQAKKYDAMLAKQHSHMRSPQGDAPPQ
jgi:predicted  nucleic acid-binding Zn-ribbon protein